MSNNVSKLIIPYNEVFVNPAAKYIGSVIKNMPIGTQTIKLAQKIIHKVLIDIVESNSKDLFEKEIELELFLEEKSLEVRILNQGVPILGEITGRNHSFLKNIDDNNPIRNLKLKNLGRRGQQVSFSINYISPETIIGKVKKQLDVINADDLIIREIKLGEESLISELFYYVYEYNYVYDYVYYPEELSKLIKNKTLISLAAFHKGGSIIGHVGLLKKSENPLVYDACLGVVNPRVTSKGIFKKLFAEVMKRVRLSNAHFAIFDFVTNHVYSQRLISSYGTDEMAIFVANQVKETQANLEKIGIGEDPKDSDRYSLLFSIISNTPFPFGRRSIHIPENIGNQLGFLLKPFHLNWSPTSRFDTLNIAGEYFTHINEHQKAVVFDFFSTGRSALYQIIRDWKKFLKEGYKHASINVPIEYPGLGLMYEILSNNGFFMAGFIPYKFSNKLGFCFQAVGPARINFDQIKVFTEDAKKLLSIIKKDYERNSLL